MNWIFEGGDAVDISSYVTRTDHNITLAIPDVTRNMAGEFKCLADNGFHADPVSKTVTVNVEYPPSIQISEAFIVSDISEEQVVVLRL